MEGGNQMSGKEGKLVLHREKDLMDQEQIHSNLEEGLMRLHLNWYLIGRVHPSWMPARVGASTLEKWASCAVVTGPS
jgi:hypothetical protein